jgi:hypothetical protein
VSASRLRGAIEKSIASEKQLSFISGGGASSFQKYEDIMKLINKVNISEPKSAVSAPKTPQQEALVTIEKFEDGEFAE